MNGWLFSAHSYLFLNHTLLLCQILPRPKRCLSYCLFWPHTILPEPYFKIRALISVSRLAVFSGDLRFFLVRSRFTCFRLFSFFFFVAGFFSNKINRNEYLSERVCARFFL